MARVPTVFSATSPIALASAWSRINSNCLSSFNKFMRKHIMHDFTYYSVLASELGYIPAEQRALQFAGSPYESMSSADRKSAFVNPKIDVIIAPFLREKNFSTPNCIKVINDLLSSASDVPSFTYGNAQKWVNMSIKYYLILMSLSLQISGSINDVPNNQEKSMLGGTTSVDIQSLYNKTSFWHYDLFPIDTPMCKHVTADLGTLPPPVYTPYPWSNNNARSNFEDYWNLVLHELPKHGWTGFIPCLYEMYVW